MFSDPICDLWSSYYMFEALILSLINKLLTTAMIKIFIVTGMFTNKHYFDVLIDFDFLEKKL